jgi:hypothetical protein
LIEAGLGISQPPVYHGENKLQFGEMVTEKKFKHQYQKNV